MRTRLLAVGGLLVLLVAVVALRWPRMEPGLVAVTRSETQAEEMVVEYRMPRPFDVALVHGVRRPAAPLGGPGIRVGGEAPARREPGEIVPSEYDWVRGEHYVRLTFRRRAALVVEGNGRRQEFPAWSAPDARDVRWHPPVDKCRLGDGCGNDVASFAGADWHEYLMVYAGTGIREWVE
jgi:hypothetical protein